jgi:hypothetical protein
MQSYKLHPIGFWVRAEDILSGSLFTGCLVIIQA